MKRAEKAGEIGARLGGAVSRGRQIEMIVDGRPIHAFEGESVAAALLAAGVRALRVTARRGEPRGMFCGIGICFDCVMSIDGLPNTRACQTPARAGMRIESQKGNGSWNDQGHGHQG
ncbi:MAG: (2Fe-2S)-binding protein [Xanthomonadales bacterium]|nr:(2Fe-2S)-binding protein [Xanthomonadales bacterium]